MGRMVGQLPRHLQERDRCMTVVTFFAAARCSLSGVGFGSGLSDACPPNPGESSCARGRGQASDNPKPKLPSSTCLRMNSTP